MVDAARLREIALSLAGTSEAPHFDRAAFKVVRNYCTLAADQLTANLKLNPDEQALKCLVAADAFCALPNAWGRQGWTALTLAAVNEAELLAALTMAWQHALAKPAKSGSPRSRRG